MKENYLARPSKSWKSLSWCIFFKENWQGLPRAGNPYPGAFYEGELPGKAFLEILILVHFLKENYLARPSKSWQSLSWCIL